MVLRFAIFAAEDYIEDPSVTEAKPYGGRRWFKSPEEAEQCIQDAIEHARDEIITDALTSALITVGGLPLALVRPNIHLDSNPWAEVARFQRPYVSYGDPRDLEITNDPL